MMNDKAERQFENGFKREYFDGFDRAGEETVAAELAEGIYNPLTAGLARSWLMEARKKRAEEEARKAAATLDLMRRSTEASERAALAAAIAAIAAAVAAAWPYISVAWNLPGAP